MIVFHWIRGVNLTRLCSLHHAKEKEVVSSMVLSLFKLKHYWIRSLSNGSIIFTRDWSVQYYEVISLCINATQAVHFSAWANLSKSGNLTSTQTLRINATQAVHFSAHYKSFLNQKPWLTLLSPNKLLLILMLFLSRRLNIGYSCRTSE